MKRLYGCVSAPGRPEGGHGGEAEGGRLGPLPVRGGISCRPPHGPQKRKLVLSSLNSSFSEDHNFAKQ